MNKTLTTILYKIDSIISPTVYTDEYDTMAWHTRARYNTSAYINGIIDRSIKRAFINAIGAQLENHISGRTLLMEIEMGGYSPEENAKLLLSYADKYGWADIVENGSTEYVDI